MDYWRNYFRSANSDIFGVIDHAIMVAASDCPKEFRMRRDRIAERLFSSKLTQCSGCRRVELAVPAPSPDDAIGGQQEEEEGGDEEIDVCGDFEEGAGSKGSKVNSSSRPNETPPGEANLNDQLGSNYSYDEAEALTDEIEEQSQVFDEVLRLKSVILNHRDETDSTLFDSLRRLQLMALSVDTIKATEIGKVVNGLRKHGSAEIRHLARTLIDFWKDLVDEWFNASKTLTSRNESTPDSGNPSVLDEEEGLPSPPMDEGIFFATQATGMELSQFFDGMDDDGNPRNVVETNRNRGNGRKPSSHEARSIPKPVNPLTRNSQQMKSQPATMRPLSKPLNNNSGPKQNLEQKVNNSSTLQRRTDQNQIGGQRNPSNGLQQQNKLKCSDEVAVQMKLEATKRKLQESYQQANNAKRQRTIQVMELHDLPKQGNANRNPNMMKHGNGNRHWANGRR
ncbi:Probable mediator of RNA polymerase II transcription subunit 26b [Linum grandiflorum]